MTTLHIGNGKKVLQIARKCNLLARFLNYYFRDEVGIVLNLFLNLEQN